MQNLPYPDPTREKLLDAALPLVVFDGWGPETFAASVSDSGVSPDLAAVACPRGATDLAVAYHKRGDRALVAAYAAADTAEMTFRDKVTLAVWLRLQAVEREVVRRGMTLFSLPHLAPEGARLLWETSDVIWTAVGDSSDDVNWYTKRATLSGVFGATVLFWLGDDSAEFVDTQAFLERRIADVMQVEKVKAQMKGNRLASAALMVPNFFLSKIKAPAGVRRCDVPGTQAARAGVAQKGAVQ
ncbi:hypothetical protein AQS8620_02069 [Aquimixticola soesokkakensis]|uniref:COQ9 C-terminal domain-containing protein n=1 Tax=Aquimixticola soesokkakensis TaxID=1519096 RepID=A0A1Y5SXA2_9RHOB|nr:COQ9 family protein [Aquimixticola soesokkakensis]SLN48966.1 hypothetical protein AQS8620_02069 [Aquimixticola soesokkakensis]